MPTESRTLNQSSGEVSPERLPAMASIIREFFIDFLSSLVPGFLFTMFAIPLLISSAVVLSRGGFAWDTIRTDIEPYHAELWCLILVVSYVLGSVYSRRDPKVPDQRSATHILWKDWDSRTRAVIQPSKGANAEDYTQFYNPAGRVSWLKRYQMARRIAQGDGGQFPYSHLYEYLTARKLGHLAERVPWHGEDDKIDPRSKMFINILKVRLQFSNQKQCGEIIRNEAHIRMMSSVWYAALQLEQVYVVLLFLLLILSPFNQTAKTPGFKTILILLVVLLVAARWLRRSIIKFLHYQRVREIVYVLETAHTAWRNGHDNIFEGLKYSPPTQ
ncbi:MAG: hypothetical protein WBM14_07495 [Terracidiphilus sp.]|jgi:hypothetical protein